LPKISICPQKSPVFPPKSPIFLQKCPILVDEDAGGHVVMIHYSFLSNELENELNWSWSPECPIWRENRFCLCEGYIHKWVYINGHDTQQESVLVSAWHAVYIYMGPVLRLTAISSWHENRFTCASYAESILLSAWHAIYMYMGPLLYSTSISSWHENGFYLCVLLKDSYVYVHIYTCTYIYIYRYIYIHIHI